MRARTINYRNTAAIADIGWSPNEQLRIGSLFTYSLSDTGNPNTIFDPRPIDHFLTERWLIGTSHRLEAGRLVGPQIDFQLRSRATDKRSERGRFRRADTARSLNGHKSIIKTICGLPRGSRSHPSSPVFSTAALDAGQELRFILQIFGPQPTFVSDHTEEIAGFLEADTSRQSRT